MSDYEPIQTDLELYDSDREALAKVRAILSDAIGQRRDVDAFKRECIERIAEQAGFVVDVIIYEDDNESHLPKEDRTYYPVISIRDRIEHESEFDHDKMGHEVRRDLLGLRGGDNRQPVQVAPGFSRTESGIIVPHN